VDRAAYVALALTPGIGAARLGTLLRIFDSPDGALKAPFAFLCSLPGFSRAAATAICSARVADGERVLQQLDQLSGHCLLPGDPGFPPLLKTIPDPPTLLFVTGNLELLARPMVSIVGSRDHSEYGREVAIMIAGHAARSGIPVVSGMARGLDAVAHSAALAAGGETVGVLGNGLGVTYPAANRQLYELVARSGLLITEFPPGERPRVGSFPRRNRLISGLSRVTLVIEAAQNSGTLITVESALAQGREVMAVPGAITSPTSVGTNQLLRDGATPLLEADDLLQFYPEIGSRPQLSRAPSQPNGSALPDSLTPEERDLASLLHPAPRHLDDIVRESRRSVGEVLAALSGLELAGVAEQLPGWRFRRG
jgi:DNA processing protein